MLFLTRRADAGGVRPVLACLTAWCLLATPAWAQDDLLFDTWTIEDGLPQNSVNDIVQTPDGYLWLATYGGLVRFDGVRFVVFDRSIEGVDSVRTRALHVDSSGTLWAGTDDGALLRYRDGRFTTFDVDDGLTGRAVIRIDDGDAGDIWIVWEDHMTRFDGERFVSYRPADFPHAVRPHVLGPQRYPAQAVWWSIDEAGVHCLAGGRVELCLAAEELSPSSVTGVSTDGRGTWWFQLEGATAVRKRGTLLTVLSASDGLPQLFPGATFLEDGNGTLWLNQYGGSLHRVRDGRAIVVFDRSTFRVFQDREGSIWLGTEVGLLRVRARAISTITKDDGLSWENVYSILRDRQGELWIGTWGGGLIHMVGLRTRTYGVSDGLPAAEITAIFEDGSGRLLIGTQAGLVRMSGDRLVPYHDPMGWLKGSVWAIHQDHEAIWFGTDHGLVRQVGDRFERFTTADGLSHDTISALFEDRTGALWVGTRQGLTVLRNGEVSSFTDREGFVGNQVRALHEDEDGVLWIGTYDGGLYRHERGRLTRYTTQNGLHDNGIFQILDDGRGHFWIGSNRGIYRVDRAELNALARGEIPAIHSTAFGTRDGMAMIECNGGRQPSGARMPDGMLWFPTQGGIAIVNPAVVTHNPHAPAVLIEEIRLRGETAPLSDTLDVPPDRNSLTVRYTAMTFVRPEQTKFRYRLAGLDDDWIEAGIRREATYYRIPPGEYRFEVMAANSDGVWSASPAAVRIVVHAPFWRRAWFVAMLSLALVGIAVAAVRRRLLGLAREHARQQAFARQLIETQEQERRRISNELHDALGQDLFMIKTRAKASRQETPDTTADEALQSIEAMATESYAGLKRIAHGLRPYQLDKIGLSRTIENMLQRVAETCDVRFDIAIGHVDDCFPPDAAISVFRIVQEAVNNVIRHAGARHARVRVDHAGTLVEIVVADDGRGFDVTSAGAESGFGLMGIRERAQALGGALDLQSTPGRGTVLRVTLPLEDGHHG